MCGIFGVVAAEGVGPSDGIFLPAVAADGLLALQHRGTESAGLVGSDGVTRDHLEIVKGCGLVRDVLTDETLPKFSDSRLLMGHTRYSTAGKKAAINCVQPFVVYTAIGTVAIAHNGELVDARAKRKEVLEAGVGLSTDTDSELIAQMVAKAIALNIKCHEDEEKRTDIHLELAVTMSALNISYSLLVMTTDRLYAIRDPFGNRPLCIGTQYSTAKNGATRSPLLYFAASESCALPPSAVLNFEVKPGEIVCLSSKGIQHVCQMKPSPRQAFCIFEYVYFSRADSILEGQQVAKVREECGRQLAREASVVADAVCTVPDSAMAASIGFASESGIPFIQALSRNSYVGRSFIQPSNLARQTAVKRKFAVLTENVRGKRIVLIDDSIVRGNTMGILVGILKEAGALEVHLRIASPPVRHPCYMGINIPSKEELIANGREVADIQKMIGADSVGYLSVDGLVKAVQKAAKGGPGGVRAGHCTACLTGDYPVDIEDL